MEPIIREVYLEGDIKIYMQYDLNRVSVSIAQYSESIDKTAVQKDVLVLWKNLKEYNDSFEYNIGITYYPKQYKEVIEGKNTSVYRYDFSTVYLEETVSKLMENNEIIECLIYIERSNRENTNNLNTLLQKYEDGSYDENVIWEYWIQ